MSNSRVEELVGEVEELKREQVKSYREYKEEVDSIKENQASQIADALQRINRPDVKTPLAAVKRLETASSMESSEVGRLLNYTKYLQDFAEKKHIQMSEVFTVDTTYKVMKSPGFQPAEELLVQMSLEQLKQCTLSAILYSTTACGRGLSNLSFAFPKDIVSPPLGTYQTNPNRQCQVDSTLREIMFGMHKFSDGEIQLTSLKLKDHQNEIIGYFNGTDPIKETKLLLMGDH